MKDVKAKNLKKSAEEKAINDKEGQIEASVYGQATTELKEIDDKGLLILDWFLMTFYCVHQLGVYNNAWA